MRRIHRFGRRFLALLASSPDEPPSGFGRLSVRPRRLHLETLEERALLSVLAGGTDGIAANVSLPPNIEGNLAAYYAATVHESAANSGNPSVPKTSGPATSAAADAASNLLQLDQAGRPLVDVWTTSATATVASELEGTGAQVVSTSDEYHLVEAWVDVTALSTVAAMNGVLSVTPVYRPICRTGSVTSQGDSVLHADDVRDPAQFPPSGYDGTGVKVGVLSDSVSCYKGGLADSVASGDLPADVEVLKDYSGSDGTDEGRAMLEIVHDLAPGASLAFYTAYESELDFAQGIRALAQDGAGVIVDDVAYLDEPFFQDGIVGQAVNDVVSQYGVTYVTAAGNDADRGYEATFSDAGGGFHNFNPSGTAATWQQITVPNGVTATLILQWDDPFYSANGVTHDFNVTVDDAGGKVVASGTTDNIATQLPEEVISWTGSGTGIYQVEIQRVAGSGTSHLKYILSTDSDQGSIDQFATHSGTVFGHAAAAGAISVGAVPFYDPGNIEPYSSRGTATVYFDPQGNRLATPEVRNKPDMVATDAVNTSFFGTDIAQDPDSFPNFSGTSAAAPHVAAVAALLLSAKPSLSPTQVLTAMQSTATDLGPAGWDSTYGSGLVDASAATTEVLNNPVYNDTTGPRVALQSPGASTARPIGFVDLQFNEALNSASAQNAANYDLRSSGNDGVFGNGDDVIYAVTATYDATHQRVHLIWTTPATMLLVGQYQLTVGTGVQDLAGNPLNDGTAQVFSFQRTVWGQPFPVVPQGGTGGGIADVAVSPSGGSMLVWIQTEPQYSSTVYASIYDANGVEVSGPFVVYSDYDIESASVAYDPTGHFIVTYYDRVAFDWGVLGLIKYDMEGRQGWATTVRSGWHWDADPDVAVDGQGDIFVAWHELMWSGDDNLFLRKFAADGTPLTAPIRLDDATVFSERRSPSVAVTPSGEVVVAWYEYGAGTIDARLLDAQGNLIGTPFVVASANPDYYDKATDVARIASQFVVTWDNGGHAYYRLYDDAGNARTDATQVDSPDGCSKHLDTSVTMNGDGSFAVAFIGGAGHLMLRQFDANGAPLGTEFEVPWDNLGTQSGGALGVDGQGNVLVAWGGSPAGPVSSTPYARWLVNPLPTAPDLRVTQLSAPAHVVPGVTEQVTADVWDFGIAPVAHAGVRYTLSGDAILGNADDQPLVVTDSDLSFSCGGTSQSDSRDFVLPADLSPGTYYLHFRRIQGLPN
jgi:subtilisin family serine protease